MLSCDVKSQLSTCKYQSIIHCVKVTSQKIRKLSDNDPTTCISSKHALRELLDKIHMQNKTLSCVGAGNKTCMDTKLRHKYTKSRQY